MPACSQRLLSGLWGRLSPLGFTCPPTKGRVCLGPTSSQGTALVPLQGNLFYEAPFCCLRSINKLSCKTVSFRLTDPPTLGPVRVKSLCPDAGWTGKGLSCSGKAEKVPSNCQQPTKTHRAPLAFPSVVWEHQLASDGAWLFSISQRNG